ncbi:MULTISPECIES: BON domain-containing protein [Streptomyces]|uniref:BON domain-containing protein n=1 Tax=Streptomyces pratisoli TaxID=3139917 RepID=A0ACC6QTA0_9ACTN|nr:BON domain-containing protein [Streptomyces sp. NBC_00259]
MNTTGAEGTEYRIVRLRERLAGDDVAELGIRVEERGGAVLLSGTVATAVRRDEILRIAAEELGETPVRPDLVIVSAEPPDSGEELP